MSQLLRIEQELITVRDYIRWAASSFNEAQIYFGHGTDNAWDEAVFLVLGALHLPWNTDPAVLDARLTQSERERVSQLIRRRSVDRVPAPYLLKEAWYAGKPYYVDERVLIPRSPIAELIEHGFSPWLVIDEVNSILDLCCGSGCIGMACAEAFPDAEVVLADLSKDALEVAEINLRKHQLEDRVTLVQSDLFAQIPSQHFDLIVTNPPYVDKEDMDSLPAEYRHEPRMALESGEDGLNCIRGILKGAADYLSEYGVLIAEVGNSQPALDAAFPDVPFMWLDFDHGGHGVFVLTAAQLKQHQPSF